MHISLIFCTGMALVCCTCTCTYMYHIIYTCTYYIQWSPLLLAARNGHAKVCRKLLDKGASVNRPRDSETGYTPLMVAIDEGNRSEIHTCMNNYIYASQCMYMFKVHVRMYINRCTVHTCTCVYYIIHTKCIILCTCTYTCTCTLILPLPVTHLGTLYFPLYAHMHPIVLAPPIMYGLFTRPMVIHVQRHSFPLHCDS